jgi:acetoin utilization deacetylase AcuC-like enzyme
MLIYSPKYNTDLNLFGLNKPFALDRGQMVLDKLEKDTGKPVAYQEPALISFDDLKLVHSKKYLESLANVPVWEEIFELSDQDYNKTNAQYPLNELLDDIRLKCGGTKLACELALKHGLAANLGGGYHHTFPDRGRGFCVLHDIAVAIKSLQKRKLVERVMVVDTDFHQGDGTALVFKGDPNVFTFSIHSQEGWPEEKQESSLDVPVFQGEENLYQNKLETGLKQALAEFSPGFVVYVAGSDPYELDVLPGTRFLNLSLEQLEQRDKFVISRFHKLKIPLAMVFAGGYGPHVWQVHYQAVKHLLDLQKQAVV